MRVITPRLSSTGSLNRTGAGLDMLRGALGDLVRIEQNAKVCGKTYIASLRFRARPAGPLSQERGLCVGSCDMKEAAPRIKLAPLNGAAPSKRGPGRPPKGSNPKRGPKALDPGEIDRELRQTGDAFLNELFPHGWPAGFEINLRSAKWRFGPVRRSVGRFNLWCHVRKVTPKEAARQIQEWLRIPGQSEPELTPPAAKEKAAAKYAPKVFDLTDAELQFRDAADKRGLKLPLKLESDGKLHRCGTDDDEHGSNGAYILHLDGVPAGGFQNWKDGEPWENWRADSGRTLTDAERKAYAERTERNRVAAEAEKARRWKEAAKKAAEYGERSGRTR